MDTESDTESLCYSSIMETNQANKNFLQELIFKMNHLRDICIRAGIMSPLIIFPQIVVIGGQSSGKSSVLESFVGKDFLPRGSGTVTRCPLILNMVHSNTPREFACFEHTGETEYTNFQEVKKEIIKQTSKLNGSNHAISDEPIKLTIHSPNVVNLTLVDLPGVTRVPKGDQQKDIEKVTREMILKYIRDENCIILAVSAANQDLNTSDALMLAKEVDPEGVRTIGVLTKLDIMDKGTNALNELQGNGLFPLRLGYVAVLNRSQEDIDQEIDIIEARKNEDKFFAESPIYRHMAHKLGSTYLQKILNNILTKKIHEKIPEIKNMFQQQYLEFELKQQKFCGFLEERKKFDEMESEERTNFLRRERAHQISLIADEFAKMIGRQDFGNVDLDDVSRGALINEIITIKHSKQLDQIELNREHIIKKLKIAIVNVRGAYGGIFTPDSAFNEVIKYIINRFGEPSVECLSQVTHLLRLTVDDCVKKVSRYPVLRDSVRNVLKSVVGYSMRETQEHIKNQTEFQKSKINDQHEDFHQMDELRDPIKPIRLSTIVSKITTNLVSNACPPVVKRVMNAIGAEQILEEVIETITDDSSTTSSSTTSSSTTSSGNTVENEFDRDYMGKVEMIESYSKILKKFFKDMVPRVILHSLIDKTKSFFKVELEAELDKKYSLLDLMEIDEEERMEVEDFLRKKNVIEQVLTELSNF